MPYFIEDSGKEQKAYETFLVDNPKLLGILSNDLALKIIKMLASEPQCAMDIARKLKQHEQKIYYHIRNLEKAGLAKLIKTEERVGALAKIYAVDYPAVAFKLFEGKEIVNAKMKVSELKFFENFIDKGELNALIVVGSPDPHGKYAAQASDSCCAIDLALFLGTIVKNAVLPNYKLDTEVSEAELKNNLILVGGPKANIVVEKMNKKLPIYFDLHREWNIVSPFSKNIYTEDDVGLVAKIKNPFYEKSEVLVLAGKRFRGTRAAMIAVVNYLKEIEKGNRFDTAVKVRVVQGIDRDSDGRVDDVEFLE